jgi:AcrR family transcriptional regulator
VIRPGLREQRKARTRRDIQEHALRLFLANGYDATTVEQIAAAAGVSHMTFFRYFPSKEAVVVENDDYDPILAELIRARPREETPLTALRNAVMGEMVAVYETDREALLVRSRLIFTTPALRARVWRMGESTEKLFSEALADQQGTEVTFELRVLAAAVFGAFSLAISTWVDGDGDVPLPALIERAFDALTDLGAHPDS